jgi:hypothetical protein
VELPVELRGPVVELPVELREPPVELPVELRDPAVELPVELRGPVVELSDSLVAATDAGLVASSIAVRCRDNAVPSVCVAPHLPLPINTARKEVHTPATSARKERKGLPGIQ